MKNNRAAMEMTMGTVVVIVLSVSLLIFGMLFVRNIMCSGIVITDKVSEKVENEIQNLFGAADYGVKCMGSGGQEVTLGDGGKRQVICIINTDEQAEYEITIDSIESLSGADDSVVKSWVLDQNWGPDEIKPGQTTVTALVLKLPKEVSATSLKIKFNIKNNLAGTSEAQISYIDVTHVGGFNSAIC